ncbi:MAG: hypothetical protein H7145_20920 [Akkermansiaceae bacterium]|nr:hypothetical protein [Armatimonadota bacterium]
MINPHRPLKWEICSFAVILFVALTLAGCSQSDPATPSGSTATPAATAPVAQPGTQSVNGQTAQPVPPRSMAEQRKDKEGL